MADLARANMFSLAEMLTASRLCLLSLYWAVGKFDRWGGLVRVIKWFDDAQLSCLGKSPSEATTTRYAPACISYVGGRDGRNFFCVPKSLKEPCMLRRFQFEGWLEPAQISYANFVVREAKSCWLALGKAINLAPIISEIHFSEQLFGL
jgi:hypothetical protein